MISPWHVRWGAELEDDKREVPGGDLLPNEGTPILHAVTIDAPVEEMWPWLAQLGQDRAGFYSYEWLENLAGNALNLEVVAKEVVATLVGSTGLIARRADHDGPLGAPGPQRRARADRG